MKSFFDFYFKVMGNANYVEKPKDEDWIAKFLIEFQRELLLWGSDSVLRSYIDFKKTLEKQSLNVIEGEDPTSFLAPTINAAAKLLKCMRQDIGYRFTSFGPRDLVTFQIQSSDPYFDELLKKLD